MSCSEKCVCDSGFLRNHRGECFSNQECEEVKRASKCFQELQKAEAKLMDTMMVGVFVPSCQGFKDYKNYKIWKFILKTQSITNGISENLIDAKQTEIMHRSNAMALLAIVGALTAMGTK